MNITTAEDLIASLHESPRQEWGRLPTKPSMTSDATWSYTDTSCDTCSARYFHSGGLALDIDETLAWTGGHWMIKMQRLFGNPERLTPSQMFQKYKLCQNVPYWASNPDAMQWIHERRSCAETASELPVIADAVECVRQINGTLVPVLAYITVRPDSLADVTAHWLAAKGFVSANLICRPSHVPFENGNKWKAEVIEQLYPYIGGIVDDNPLLLFSFLPRGYRGFFFLFGHSEDKAADIVENFEDKCNSLRKDGMIIDTPDIVVCNSWQDVLKRATAIYASTQKNQQS
mmetsp:Transcript_26831/g.79292  ORF Transcript_26831/g.79292 Transcript_26831/m.79292 type:complete len:288 (-) Transcript_26831:1182-2045(-)